MEAVEVPLDKAEEVKRFLIRKGILHRNYRVVKEGTSVFFPLESTEGIMESYPALRILDKGFERSVSKAKAMQEELKGIEGMKRAFDVIGDIAVIESDNIASARLLSDFILSTHRNINTVVRKEGIHSGEFRVQDVEHVAGEKKTETVHRENGVRLKLDVGKLYFSPRLSTERKRIMEQVKGGESILVMFSGAAPYPAVLSRNTKAAEITAIEINPVAHRYAEENIRLNRIKNVKLYEGDVRETVPNLDKKFDRILMPLPKSAEDFLDTALSASKNGTMVHFYDFLHRDRFSDAHAKIEEACRRNGLKCSIISTTRCGQHAPYTYRICVDFRITGKS